MKKTKLALVGLMLTACVSVFAVSQQVVIENNTGLKFSRLIREGFSTSRQAFNADSTMAYTLTPYDPEVSEANFAVWAEHDTQKERQGLVQVFGYILKPEDNLESLLNLHNFKQDSKERQLAQKIANKYNKPYGLLYVWSTVQGTQGRLSMVDFELNPTKQLCFSLEPVQWEKATFQGHENEYAVISIKQSSCATLPIDKIKQD